MFVGLTQAVIQRPWLVIVVMALSVLAFGNGIRFLTTDTDVTRDLPQRIPAKALYDRIDDLFPSKETVVIGVVGEDLFTADGVARLHRLTRRLEDLEGVQSVLGPTNARIIRAVDGGMEVGEAADPLPETDAEALSFKERLLDQPMLAGAILSEDHRAVAMLVFVRAGAREADVAERVIELIEDPARNEGLACHVTGRAAATYWSKIIMAKDMSMLTSAALLIVLFMLIAIFRSARGVLLPIGVVVTAAVWTLGLMGYLGIPITHSTEILPILLVAIGVADGIHVLKGYYARARTGITGREVVLDTMADLNRPVILTSITTSAGFIALGSSGIESITLLGLLTAFGVMAAMVFSLTFIPAVLVLMKLPGVKSTGEGRRTHFLGMEGVAGAYARFLARSRWLVTAGVIVVILGAIVGALRVPVEMSNLSNFRADHPFRVDTEIINEHFGTSTGLIVVIEGGEPDAIKDPVVLEKMDALENWLREQPHVGSVQSITGFIKQMHRVMHDDTPSGYRLPSSSETVSGSEWVEIDGEEVERETTFEVDGRELVAQYLALYEMSGQPGDFANLVTYDYSTARIDAMIDSDRASVLTLMHDGIRGFIDENFGEVSAELTGMSELMRAVNEMVVTGQAWSIATSLLLVFLVASVVFKSPALGLFATLPLFFSLFLNFGTMGLTGIPLNVMTMATSSVAVGVGIDYAIHFVHRYQHDRLRGLSWDEAVESTMRTSGVAIVLNASTVALGFAALGFSQFTGVGHMGLLIALTMVTSAFAALTILPVLFLLIRPRVLRSADMAAGSPDDELREVSSR